MKLKKFATPGMIVFLLVGLLVVNHYAENLAIKETTALIFSQFTEKQGDTCIYYDGIGTCEVPIENCAGTEKHAISLGLCDSPMERQADVSRAAEPATWGFLEGQTTFKVKPRKNVPIRGSVIVPADGTYIIEAGLVDYTKLKEAGRLGIKTFTVTKSESICDKVKQFASGRAVDAKAGDIINFNLYPLAPNEKGDYEYEVYLANGCFVGPTAISNARIIDKASTVIKVEVTEDGDDGETISVITEAKVWDDIKKDFKKLTGWLSPYKDKIKGKYVLYGILALVGIIVLIILISIPSAPKGPRAQAPPSYGRYEQRYY